MSDISIDPRIRARRLAVLRDEGRRRLRRVVAAAVVVSGVALGWYGLQSPLLDLDHIRVEGAAQTSARVVADASGLERGEPLVSLDRAAAADRVEALPWVARAEVRRDWPGTVRIEVTERVAVARLAVGEQWALLDADGRVLALTADPAATAGLPEVRGLSDDVAPGQFLDDAADDLLAVIVALGPEVTAAVAAVDVGAEGLHLELHEGGVVVLGTTDRLAEKAVAAATVFERVELASLERLDVRAPSAPVVTRR